MDRCDGCNVREVDAPLFLRLTDVEGERVCLLFCQRCQETSNEALRQKIHLWQPPYDTRVMGVGA